MKQRQTVSFSFCAVIFSTAIVSVLVQASDLAAQVPNELPNIVFIMADDLGWKDTEPYGSTFYRTPHLNRLAERGVRFTNAYSASPLCSPTRASVLTGQWPARLRFTTPSGHVPNEVLDPKVPLNGPPHHSVVTPQTRTRLPNEYVVSSELFQKAGYTTAFMGKWHLGRAPYLPENQGFDFVVGGRHHPGPPGGYFAPYKDIDTIPDAKDGEHVDDILGREAVRFIQNNKDRPFFLNLWFYSVHGPFQAKQDLIDAARQRGERSVDQTQNCPTMAAMVETMDDNIGKVLDAIQTAGLAEKTIVIFTSDNGGNMYNIVDGTTPTSNAPLRGGKGCIYEGGHRVPLIVDWPGKVTPGSTSDAIVTSVDYFPTLLEMAGLSAPEELVLDGESLVPVLTGHGDLKRDAIFCHFPHYTPATGNHPATSVRQGDWKLIRFYGGNTDGTDRLELYHLIEDIGERNNLVASQPERVRALNERITHFLSETQALVPRSNPRYKPPREGWIHEGSTLSSTQPLLIPGNRTQPYSMTTSEIPPVISRDAVLRLRIQSAAAVSGVVRWSGPENTSTQTSRSQGFHLDKPDREEDLLITLPMDQLLSKLDVEFAPSTAPIAVTLIELSLPENPIMKWSFPSP